MYARGATYCTISNSYFNGSSAYINNGGKGEKGTKAINLMGSHHIDVINNTFEGQVLDGVSIASNSGYNNVIGNMFINNSYAIYFGGASTEGCVIANNTFDNCGWVYDSETDSIIFNCLPVISIQKAADGVLVDGNVFTACNGSVLIKAESGNTAHGYPSAIGDLNITNNEISAVEGADPYTITFVSILSNSGALNPYAPIAVVNNTIDSGITPVTVWYADWDDADGVVIPAADTVATSINIKEVLTADKTITIELVDVNGNPLTGATISYTINSGDAQNVTTDENGAATIAATEDGTIALSYAGTDTLKASTAEINFASSGVKAASIIACENMTTTAITNSSNRNGEYFNFTLTDSEGNPLVNKTVYIGFNGRSYNKTTDENGKAQLQVNLVKAGTYTFALCFLGDDENNASFSVAKITVNKQKATLTVPAKSYKASATKSLTATFKDSTGKVVSGKKVTFTVNGKTYSATTNTKGVATVKVSISKKGTYSFTAKFAGDDTFNAVTKTAKLTIK